MEPTKEGGDRTWRVATSCVQMYKAGRKCSDAGAAAELCCTTADKAVFANTYSLRSAAGGDALLTSNRTELEALVAAGWTQVCNPVTGPTAFCVDGKITDGRDGPFMLYNSAVPDATLLQGGTTEQLFRCVASDKKHFFSTSASCEGAGKADGSLGFIATKRGGETLRALRRCEDKVKKTTKHSLDLYCDAVAGGDSAPLGFVR